MAGTTGRRLILKDNTEIENGEAGYSGGFLWLYFTGYTFAEAAGMAADPEKTGVIIFQYGQMEDRYEGYTDCRVLQIDGDGNISVCLAKGAE